MLWLLAGSARAERGLIAPSEAEPAYVQIGGTLALLVEVATALTPPPGVQEERAHRAFAISLCAEGLSFGAPARSCFPLAVRNVRPVDAGSMRYRVEARIPEWLAPWHYDLRVRFPGGEAQRAQAVRLADVTPGTAQASMAQGALEIAAQPVARTLRVHVAHQGLTPPTVPHQLYPLPGEQGLRTGFVALLQVPAGVSLRLAPAAGQAAPFSIRSRLGEIEQVQLDVQPGPGKARLFWWLGPERGAEGSPVQVRFAARGEVPVQALRIEPDGRVGRAEQRVALRRRPASCALQPTPAAARGEWLVMGLLAAAGSGKLGRAACRKRRGRARE